MECTQRLQCTQELYCTQSEKVIPDQIAFLGICGSKYPVKKGPNKIGRDPSTCNIVLNFISISRHHAVINVLNKDNFMLMDLDSANKTKLSGQTLKPYIPQPLNNGDTIQFGEIFGIFRLLEEENDLPMTQAIDVPDTPIPIKHVSRLNAITTVPESPDVSDKDDSFIVPSQPKGPQFPSPKTRNFIKPGKTISIQPMGTNKIDNVYWNSSKKSASLNLDDSNASLNDSIPPVTSVVTETKTANDIHELETQMLLVPKLEEETDPIYSVNTQLPEFDNPASIYTENTQMPNTTSSPSIHNVNTQLPGAFISPSIHGLDTQIPGDNLPEVCKINEQQDMQFDLCANESIYDAKTQLYSSGKENVPDNSRNNNDSPASIKSTKLDSSNDEILFEDIEQPFEGFESQAILTEDIELPINRLLEPDFEPLSQIVKPQSAKRNMRIKSDEPESQPLSQIAKPKSAKRNMRIQSDGSTDCEDDDILPVQKIFEKKIGEDDNTDCEEDNMIELKTDTTNKSVQPENNFEDMPTQVIVNDEAPSAINNDVDFEDMPTQVLDVDVIEKDAIAEKDNANTDVNFEDLPTQVLDEDVPYKKQPILNKHLNVAEKNSPFKIPSNSALKAKKKEGSRTPKIKPIPFISKYLSKDEDNKYYQDTQDIYDDLCTQKLDPVEEKSIDKDKSCNNLIVDTSVIRVDGGENIEESVRSMTNQEVLEVIGFDNQVAQVTKVPSDGSNASDVEITPKKPLKFMDIDLPDSQEIKTSVSRTQALVTESSSESETEHNSEDQNTPVVFRKKKKSKPDGKIDLTRKFDLEALPTRVITRVRKPTARLQDSVNKKTTEILKPKFLTEQECEINKDIITENISRLKSKSKKTKNTKSNHSNQESTAAEIAEVVVEKVKNVRGCRKKGEEVIKLETNIDNAKYPIDKNSNERRKREPINIKKEAQDSKIQPSISDKSSNQSVSTVDSKDKTHVNKSKTETRDSTKSPVETKRSTRTRNAKIAKTRDSSPSPEKKSAPEKSKRKVTRKATKSEPIKEDKKEPSPEKEIRRSKRQRLVKEEVKKETPKSILKKSVTVLSEVSAVYNISSSSNSDSCSKRSYLDDSEVPSAKRKRSEANNNVTSATPARTMNAQYVLFTAFPFEAVKVKLKTMGAEVVTDVIQCTVVLTKQIKRTFKLLCAIGLGKPIVGPEWVQACADHKTIVDPWQYLIKDDVAEKRFHFSLERTLTGKRNFLSGYHVSSTPSVLPDAHEMKLIVECSGGAWGEGAAGGRWVCVSTPDDAALWPALRRRGAAVVSTEFILGGVLRQRLDIQPNTFK